MAKGPKMEFPITGVKVVIHVGPPIRSIHLRWHLLRRPGVLFVKVISKPHRPFWSRL